MSDFPKGITNWKTTAELLTTVIKLIEVSHVNINKQYTSYDTTLLHHAAEGNFCEVAKYLIESGADLNIPDSDGTTALHLVSIKGSIIIAKYLVEAGANINASDNNGYRPLHYACLGHKSNVPMVQYLLENGADRDLVDSNGQTAADVAYLNGNHMIAKCIKDYVPVNNNYGNLNNKIKINIIL